MLGKDRIKEKTDNDEIIICTPSKEEWTDRQLESYIRSKFDSGEEGLILRDFELFGISKERLRGFFAAHLGTTLSAERDIRLIKFFADQISAKTFTRTLKDRDYYYLKVFAVGASTLEEVSRYTTEEKTLRVEKFKLLLRTNPHLVDEFIEKHRANRYMEKALIEYEQAKLELNTELVNGCLNNHTT